MNNYQPTVKLSTRYKLMASKTRIITDYIFHLKAIEKLSYQERNLRMPMPLKPRQSKKEEWNSHYNYLSENKSDFIVTCISICTPPKINLVWYNKQFQVSIHESIEYIFSGNSTIDFFGGIPLVEIILLLEIVESHAKAETEKLRVESRSFPGRLADFFITPGLVLEHMGNTNAKARKIANNTFTSIIVGLPIAVVGGIATNYIWSLF